MNSVAANSINWYRVIIDDPQLANSAGFRLLVKTAIKHVPSSVVNADRLDVVPIAGTETLLPPEPDKTLSIDTFMVALESIVQLVWGRFFFFANTADAERASGYELPKHIVASHMTICVVDNLSCFVFTKSTSLVCELLASNVRLEVVKDDLSKIIARSEDF